MTCLRSYSQGTLERGPEPKSGLQKLSLSDSGEQERPRSQQRYLQGMEATQVSISDDWIRKLWYIHTMEYYSASGTNAILPFATTWVDLEGIMLGEISQRETYCLWLIDLLTLYGVIYMWNLKKNPASEYNRKETDSQIQRTNEWSPVGRGKWEGAREG